MVKFKVNVAVPKEGKTYTFEVDEPKSKVFIGKKIGDTIDGSMLGFKWKTLKITGGSDSSGFPMRPDVRGGVKKRILLSKGIGLKKIRRKGYRKKKMVRGNVVTADIYQINCTVMK